MSLKLLVFLLLIGIYNSGLLQQFSIRPEVDGVQPCDDGRDGVTQLPAPFKVVLEQRL